MKSNMCPKPLLTVTVGGKHSGGRQCGTVRHAMVDNINTIMPNVS